MTSFDLRLATDDDSEALAFLSAESFGYPRPEPPYRSPQSAAQRTYVATDDRRIVATTRVLSHASWFWGARIPSAGIASVKVLPEYRGRGLLTGLFERSLSDAVADGAALSTLFATAPGIYRKFGYETFTSYDEGTVIPTHALARVQTTGGGVRRAGESDVATVRELYDRWARAHNGPLTRDGVAFPTSDAELIEQHPGITIAVDDAGVPTGYAMWSRSGGYNTDGVLEVHDLVALTDQGMRLLLATLGTFASVAPQTVLSTSQPDLAQLVLRGDDWRVRTALPYGIAVLDVARALTMRTYPDWLDLDLTFGVTGVPVDGQDGAYRLQVSSGVAQIDRAPTAETTYEARGLALRFAGTHSSTDLRRAGLLSGPGADDSRWDAAFSGRQAHIRDYF